MNRPEIRDAVLLLLRLVLGVVFVAHGWQKVFVNGLSATGSGFEKMGIPMHDVAAAVTGLSELIGGAMLIVGILTPVVAVWSALIMLGAIWFAHLSNGLFAADGGFEYPLVLVVAFLAIAVFGAGRVSLDYMFSRKRAS